jgi:hypothetical protein
LHCEMFANDPKWIIRTDYRNGIEAKIHKFVAANNNKRLTSRPNYSPLG